MLDSKLKPWLMEVNVCPSLNTASKLDEICKTTLVCDIMNLIGYTAFEWEYFEARKLQARLRRRSRKKFGRISNITDLNSDNCLTKLSVEDWNILFEFEEEFYRKGEFERIFPNRENVNKYS